MPASANSASGCEPVAQVLDAIGAGDLVSAPETGEDIAGLTENGVPSFAPVQDSRFYFNYHHTAADTIRQGRLASPERKRRGDDGAGVCAGRFGRGRAAVEILADGQLSEMTLKRTNLIGERYQA